MSSTLKTAVLLAFLSGLFIVAGGALWRTERHCDRVRASPWSMNIGELLVLGQDCPADVSRAGGRARIIRCFG